MPTTLASGEELTVLMELGFPIYRFALGDYSTKVTRTNLIANPSFETNTTSWAAIATSGAATVWRITSDAYVGSACLRVTKGTGRTETYEETATSTVSAGLSYTISGYMKVPTGNETMTAGARALFFTNANVIVGGFNVGATISLTDTSGWQRVSVTATAPATAGYVRVYFGQTSGGTAGQTFLVDGVLVEQTSSLRPYFDGSYDAGWSGYILDGALSWSGTANASTSSGTWGLIGTEISAGSESTDGSVLDSYYLEGALQGDDVSALVQQLTVNRGRQDQLSQFSAGISSITLLNNDRRFDPTNQSSPYWDTSTGRSGVTPRRKVTIKLGSDEIFIGRITDIDLSYRTGKNTDISDVTVTAADDFVLLANTYTDQDRTPSEQLSGARLNYLLALPEIDYQGTTNISSGTATLGAYQIDGNTNALTYAQQIADAEQGFFFVARNGDLIFQDRTAAAFAAPAAAFSDAQGSGIKYQDLSIMFGQEFLYNKVLTTIIGGTTQIADDVSSQTEFGITSLSLTDLLLSTDAAALTLAEQLLSLYSQPAYRFENMLLNVSAQVSGDRALLNQLELGDTITVERNYETGSPTTITKYQTVERLSHRITPNVHLLEIAMADAYVLFPFELDDAVYGVLDALNALT
jgi:hypothetical protein